MTSYDVYDSTVNESKIFYELSAAKKWMKERLKLGHEVSGSKTKIYANGDWIPCGSIELKKSNKVFIANTRMTKENY